ncbi:integral component of membrane [Ascochyta rabiei]|uniref:Integral component of membrane n=1 Tax=Didymella rabiei TaxID=5454 RepID=A0A163I5J3_DIDRA|nr:integral component of membrane [Ascochyta rabiei]
MSHAVRDAVTTPEDMSWDPASSIPTLIGSLLSLLATATVILLWIFAGGKKRRDFRYALILNLTVAEEFLNALNNSVSGIAVVARREPLLPGTACTFNGLAGQFSVQAVDFSILAITLVTLLTIQLRSFIIYASTATKLCICLSIWMVPLCTSIIAWTKGYYGPVSGNWCWIEKRYFRQRYSLNHGWRFAIFLISLCTYVYVFIYMSRRLRPQNLSNLSSTIPDEVDYEELDSKTRDNAVLAGCGATPRISLDQVQASRAPTQAEKKHRRAVSSFSFARKLEVDTAAQPIRGDLTAQPIRGDLTAQPIRGDLTAQPIRGDLTAQPIRGDLTAQPIRGDLTAQPIHGDLTAQPPYIDEITSPQETYALVDLEKGPSPAPPEPPLTALPIRSVATRPENQPKFDREIWKMLLLNMYPVTYLILWLPGISNRIAEGMGHDIRTLVILQSSTQFIGLANATVYIYKEHRRDIREWWSGVKERKSEKAVRIEDVRRDDGSGGVRHWSPVSS